MLKTALCFLHFLVFTVAGAQNLVANGGFEDINICTEYTAPCAPEAWFRLPATNPSPTRNLPQPIDGELYEMVVMEDFSHPVDRRIFLYTWLLCPLESGRQYNLSLFINPSRQKEFRIDVCLTPKKLQLEDYFMQGEQPTLMVTDKFSVSIEADGWQKVLVPFTAKGGEEYLTIGNFDPTLLVIRKKVDNIRDIKYLIDGIALVPSDTTRPSCPDMEKRRVALYAQNDRHTNWFAEPVIETDSMPVEESVTEEYDETPPDIDTVAAPPVKFIIPDIGFDFGKFDLNPSADPVLETCAVQITALHPREIQIRGYTDDVGSEAFNRDLSAKRALAVRDWFVIKHDLPATMFVTSGLGESNPVDSNETESGRQANRRVEINFVQ